MLEISILFLDVYVNKQTFQQSLLGRVHLLTSASTNKCPKLTNAIVLVAKGLCLAHFYFLTKETEGGYAE